MNCAEFDEIVHDLDRKNLGAGPGGATVLSSAAGVAGGSVGPVGGTVFSDAALAHAESCSRCARLLTEIEGLNFALRAIAARDGQEQAPSRVETALLQALREQSGTRKGHQANKPETAGKLGSYGWYATVAGVAAVAVIAFALMRTGLSTPPRQPVTNPAVTTAETPSGSKTPLPTGQPAVSSESQAKNASNVASQSAQPSTATEEANAFYALPYANDAASVEGGAVIRVSVPRSALVSWGLPVPGMGGGEPIPADMLVSADGTPQAIRLVSEANE